MEPNDYSVIRIWICRVFPGSDSLLASASPPAKPQICSSDEKPAGSWRTTIVSRIIPTRLQSFLTKLTGFRSRFKRAQDRSRQYTERFHLDKVLMAIQTKNEDSLHLHLFQVGATNKSWEVILHLMWMALIT